MLTRAGDHLCRIEVLALDDELLHSVYEKGFELVSRW